MSAAEPNEEQVQRLTAGFRLYDRNVDVVSAWELIFGFSDTALRQRVRHFERFPSVVASDGHTVTPDFSVAFDDDTGLVAEIANFALEEASVDNLCAQIERYDSLPQLPAGGGAFAAASQVDVMLLVPLELGTAAIRRIIHDRYENAAHSYQPTVAPVVIQFTFSQDTESYVFQRRPDRGNGNFRDDSAPAEARLSQAWFGHDDVKVRPERFREIKAQRAFINDPISSLYLATFLWAKTFAVRASASGEGRPVAIEVVPADLAEQLRREHGVVRAHDIESAIALLERAKLAERSTTGWVVYWAELPKAATDRDLADTLARRSVRPPRRSTVESFRDQGEPIPETQQGNLF